MRREGHTAVCLRSITLLLFLVLVAHGSRAEYAPAKVVYDLSSGEPDVVNNILDRVSLLQRIYGDDPFSASIVVLLHEDVLPLFVEGTAGNRELIARAGSLVLGELIEFRICRTSARMQGFGDQDFPDFVQIVPMADAEIIRLQNRGYAYLR